MEYCTSNILRRDTVEKKTFKKELGKILNEYGFRYINKSYYKETEELVVVIATQKSNFSDEIYINYGFLIKMESPEIQYPRDNECDVRGRFDFQIKGKQFYSISLSSLSEKELSDEVSENMERLIVPVLDHGLAKYFEMYPELVVVANLKTKKYLNL